MGAGYLYPKHVSGHTQGTDVLFVKSIYIGIVVCEINLESRDGDSTNIEDYQH